MEEELCSILMRRFRGSLKLLMDVAYYIVCNITRFQMWVSEILVSMGKNVYSKFSKTTSSKVL